MFFPKAKAMTCLTEAERAEVVELSGAADTLEADSNFRHNPTPRLAILGNNWSRQLPPPSPP